MIRLLNLRLASSEQGERLVIEELLGSIYGGALVGEGEIELGDAESGEDNEFAVTTKCSYFKLVINGQTEIEIDLVNMVENVGGTDLLAAQRRAIGA